MVERSNGRTFPLTPSIPATPAILAWPSILVVVDSLRDNGGLRVALTYVRRWSRLGVEASVAAVQDVEEGVVLQPSADVPVTFLGWPNGRLRQILPIALIRLIRRSRRADVVVAGAEAGIGLLLSYLAARLARRPFAVLVQADIDDSIATWVPRPLHRCTRFALARCDLAVAVADSIVAGLVANGLSAEKIVVVPNGIDVHMVRERAGLAFPPQPAPSSLPPPVDHVPTVIGVGRLSAEKDFPVLIRAHGQVLAAGLRHRLVIVGDGRDRDDLAALVGDLGLASSVEFAGHLADPFPRLADADLFVLASRREGMPLALLEALAVETSVVATACSSAVEDILDGGRYGDIVPTGSVDAMAAAIQRNLGDPARLQACAAGGPARALTYDLNRSTHTLLSALSTVAAPRISTPANR